MSAELERFYDIIAELMARQGAPRFADLDGRMAWPQRGVYFVFEEGERRSSQPDVPRVVRVGTRALKSGSGTALWWRQAPSGSLRRLSSLFSTLAKFLRQR